MAENVLGAWFTDIADAIRSKTGGTEKMKPSEFAEKIEAINTSSGGSTVFTFYIGTKEYWADTGMTWAEWCASGFIHDRWDIDSGTTIGNQHGTTIDYVIPADIIEPNRTYTATDHGMGAN